MLALVIGERDARVSEIIHMIQRFLESERERFRHLFGFSRKPGVFGYLKAIRPNE